MSYPINHTLISDYPLEIRKLKTSTKTQLDHEHETSVDGDATGSEHSNGSAVAYVGTSDPTTRPGGASLAANNIDKGRLWIDDDETQIPLKRWNGSAFVTVGMSPSTYAGEESIIFPNGLILKHGNIGDAGNTPTTTDIVFDAAFPNGVISIVAQPVHSAQLGTTHAIKNVSANGFSIIDNTSWTSYYWQAWGY